MTSPKQIISVAILTLAFCTQSTFCRADDLQPTMHALVERFPFGLTKGAQWEADKKSLAGYSPEQLVHAMIVEIDLDRSEEITEKSISNHERDMAVYILFHALDLPPVLLCQELDKEQQPGHKASLMFVLRDYKNPEVTQALLRQLGDRRPAVEPRGETELVKRHAMRVCDVAYNALVGNVGGPDPKRVKDYWGDEYRDQVIQEVSAQLKLTP